MLVAPNLASPSAGLRCETLRLLCRWQQPPLPSLAKHGKPAAAALDTATSARLTAVEQRQQPTDLSSSADGNPEATASDKSTAVASDIAMLARLTAVRQEEMSPAAESQGAEEDTSAYVTAGSSEAQPGVVADLGHAATTHPGVSPPASDTHVGQDGQMVQSGLEQGNVSDRHVARSDVLPLLLALEEDDPSLGLGRLVRT